MSRFPDLGFRYNHFEIPLIYAADVPLEKQWTLVFCTDLGDDKLLNATIYNGDSARACYVHGTEYEWHLAKFDFLEGETQPPLSALCRSRQYVQDVVGSSFQVLNFPPKHEGLGCDE